MCQQHANTIVVVQGEQIAGAAVMLVLGTGVLAVGWLGRSGRLDFALGGWTKETTTDTSWREAHRIIGGWFVAAGVVAGVTGLAIVVVPAGAVGPLVVVGAVTMLAPVVIGISLGTGRLRSR